MVPSELMRRLIEVLDGRQIRYFVTGSVPTITYGDPRFTNDINVVVELRRDQVDAFCAAFPAPDYYCSRDAAIQAVEERFQFNVLHMKSGFKIDVIIPEDTDFNRSRFDRRVRVVGGDAQEALFASAEDVILKKLDYYKQGRSEKHISDIIGVLKLRAEKLDRKYIERWAERLQLADIWHDIVIRADKS